MFGSTFAIRGLSAETDLMGFCWENNCSTIDSDNMKDITLMVNEERLLLIIVAKVDGQQASKVHWMFVGR